MGKGRKLPYKKFSSLPQDSIKVDMGKKITILGTGFGYRNIGDSAMLESVVENLRRYIKEPEIKILSFAPELRDVIHDKGIEVDYLLNCFYSGGKIRSFLFSLSPRIYIILKGFWLAINFKIYGISGVSFFTNKYSKKILSDIKNSDIIIHSGGGTINDVWRSAAYMISVIYLLAGILNKKVIISGQTIGPLSGKINRFFIRYCLNKVDSIYLRDGDMSYEFLKKLGVTCPLIEKAGDDAITLPVPAIDIIDDLLSAEGINSNKIKIGINIRDPRNYKIKIKIDDFEKKMAHLCDRLIERFNADIIFIPISYHENADDRETAAKIISFMKHPEDSINITKTYTPPEIKGIISKMDMSLGISYHFLVFSLSTGIPALGIYMDEYYRMKNKGLFQAFEIEEFSFHLGGEEDIDKIIHFCEDLQKEKDKISSRLKKRYEELRISSLKPVMRAKKILESSF